MKKLSKDHVDCIIKNSNVRSFKVEPKTTVVSVVLPCGFTIVESSSCISEEYYNHEVGVDLCLQRIKEKLWELEGYRAHFIS